MFHSSATRRSFLLSIPLISASTAMMAHTKQSSTESVKRKLRFAVTSDGHYGEPGTPYEKMHDQIIGWLNEEAAAKGLDFVIFNGDLIHDDPKFLSEVKSVYSRLSVPFYVTQGNHDRVEAEMWEQVWGYPSNHAFEQNGYAFLLGTTSNKEGEYLAADLQWLEKALKEHQSAEAIFVFLHISQKKWVQNGIDSPEVCKLLEENDKVVAIFHGHDHQQDNVMMANGKHYFWDGHLGGSWGLPYHGYRIVEVSSDGKITTYQCNKEAFVVNQTNI